MSCEKGLGYRLSDIMMKKFSFKILNPVKYSHFVVFVLGLSSLSQALGGITTLVVSFEQTSALLGGASLVAASTLASRCYEPKSD